MANLSYRHICSASVYVIINSPAGLAVLKILFHKYIFEMFQWILQWFYLEPKQKTLLTLFRLPPNISFEDFFHKYLNILRYFQLRKEVTWNRYQMSYLAVVGIKGSANRSAPFSQRAAPLDKNESGDTEEKPLSQTPADTRTQHKASSWSFKTWLLSCEMSRWWIYIAAIDGLSN